MDFDLSDRLVEERLGTLEQMLGQIIAEQMAANANGGAAAGMNVPVMPIIGGSVGGGVFPLSGNTVGAGAYFVARKFHLVDKTELEDLSEFTGYIILRVSISSEDGSVVTSSTVNDPSESSCDYPLYHLTNGEVDADYRGAPHVQLYE